LITKLKIKNYKLAVVFAFGFFLFLILPHAAFASHTCTTCYIDFVGGSDSNTGASTGAAWKHGPGMTGATGNASTQVPADGDSYIFKGGVTWTSSFPWTLSGGSSSAITYTTDHTWFTGSAFTQPVFDDQGANPGATGMANTNSGTGFITINDLKFVGCGVLSTPDLSNKCLVFNESHDITITNSTFRTYSWISIYMVFGSAGSYSNFTLIGNDFANTSGALWFASAQSNTSMHNLTYTNNVIHDFSSQIGNGVHGDGFLHYFSSPSSDATQYADGIVFCDNRAYGDFRNVFDGGPVNTAMFFVEGAVTATVCNNDFSFTPVVASMFQAFILLAGNSNAHAMAVGIYNNSLANIGTNAMSAAIDLTGMNNVTIKNNVVSGMQYPVYVEDVGSETGFTSDYNLYNGTSGQLIFGGSFQSYATWQGAGRDTHSVLGSDPLWLSAPGNEHLGKGSPAISAGTNLVGLGISILNSDYSSNKRPSSANWDMGAYQVIRSFALKLFLKPNTISRPAVKITRNTRTGGLVRFFMYFLGN